MTSPAGAPYAPTSGKADAEAVKWNRVVAHVLGGVGGSGTSLPDAFALSLNLDFRCGCMGSEGKTRGCTSSRWQNERS